MKRTFKCEGISNITWELDDGKVWYVSKRDGKRYPSEVEEQELLDAGKFVETTPPPTVRYFVPKPGEDDEVAYWWSDGQKAGWVFLNGKTDFSGMLVRSFETDETYIEVSEAQAKARLNPPKVVEKPRYFVHTAPFFPAENDHYRLNGQSGVWVSKSGDEVKDGYSGQRLLDLINRHLRDGEWKEVFPESSESLLRSHRYAEKYEEGKAKGLEEGRAKGHEEGYKVGYAQAVKYVKERYEDLSTKGFHDWLEKEAERTGV